MTKNITKTTNPNGNEYDIAIDWDAELNTITRQAYHLPKTIGTPPTASSKINAQVDALVNDGAMDKMSYVVDRSALNSWTQFVGYPVLNNLAQDALIRLCINTRTDEMVRKWIDITADNEDTVDQLKRAVTDYKIQGVIKKALTVCGFMGGAYIFVDDGSEASELVNPLNISDRSGTLKDSARPLRFVVIEPMFTTPSSFESANPMSENFYNPSVFFVQGVMVHRSRLIRIVENEVPDFIKPQYNFLGIPQAQLLSNYVTAFRANREETNRMLKKFSSSFVKGNLKAQLFQGASRKSLDDRMKMLAKYRDNNGVFLIDKETEDFAQINTPLAGLTDIVRQSLEHVVAVNGTGVVKTLGLSPAGFSATGESDMQLQAAMVETRQQTVLRDPIEKILRILQLRTFGHIDESVKFTFIPTLSEDARLKAERNKIKADTTAVYIDRGIISEDEARENLRTDDESGYSCLEGDAPGMDDVPFGQMGEAMMSEQDDAGKIY